MNIKYKHNKKGLIGFIYGNQCTNAKARGHAKPSYTVKQLREWAMEQEMYHTAFECWERGGFQKRDFFMPSVDRIDDSKSYTFGNIKLTTWGQNFKSCKEDQKTGKLRSGKPLKRVKSITKDGVVTIYRSVQEASRQTNVNISSISRVCNKIAKSAGGMIWQFA